MFLLTAADMTVTAINNEISREISNIYVKWLILRSTFNGLQQFSFIFNSLYAFLGHMSKTKNLFNHNLERCNFFKYAPPPLILETYFVKVLKILLKLSSNLYYTYGVTI